MSGILQMFSDAALAVGAPLRVVSRAEHRQSPYLEVSISLLTR